MNTCLGVILARGGSKRIPGKNIQPLDGIPLINWTISAACRSRFLTGFVVSSDDDGILEVARECMDGAMNTIKRPQEMATDEASSYPALMHALGEQPKPYDYVCLLQPTSPFRGPGDIDNCLSLAVFHNWPFVSVALGSQTPNGAIYVAPVGWLRETLARGDKAPFDGDMPGRFYMEAARSIDIDTPEDFEAAEAYAAEQYRAVVGDG
tara:strand:+ start:223 stop:846 length:624 start_codon:yes stop_codon:yes gene_type:complete